MHPASKQKMSLNVARTPATQSIFNLPNVNVGNSTGTSPGNFGIGGPGVPSTQWAPRGDGTDQTGPAGFLGYGQPPTSHGHITLKAFDFIQYQYTVGPWDDDSHLHMMPDMLVWTLNGLDPDLDTHHVRALPQLNQQCVEAWTFFQDLVREGDDEALEFQRFLETYGEDLLGQYINARNKDRLSAVERKKEGDAPAENALFSGTGPKGEDVASDLKRFYALHTKDTFCYMTKWGILHRWSFAGAIINVNRAVSLEIVDATREEDHFVEVNVGLAKRIRVGNVFGKLRQITTGSKVWVVLRRKELAGDTSGLSVRAGPFEFVPGGDTMRDRPAITDTQYYDEGGRRCNGHVYKIGTVIEPSDYDPQTSAIQGATNLGATISTKKAYECHALVPTMYLAMGFKH